MFGPKLYLTFVDPNAVKISLNSGSDYSTENARSHSSAVTESGQKYSASSAHVPTVDGGRKFDIPVSSSAKVHTEC
jgi:hypothetical protein